MKNEDLNLRLYEKMCAEQETFEDWLLGQSPRDILNHAYEYTIREDILLWEECNDLEDEECEALLKLDNTLDAIYQCYDRCENDHVDYIYNCISAVATRNMSEK